MKHLRSILTVYIIIAISVISGIATAQFVSPPSVISIPSGGNIIITSGSCPAGFTVNTALQGFFIVGTPAAGTLGGSKGSAMTDLADAGLTVAQMPAHTHQETVNVSSLATQNTSGLVGGSPGIADSGQPDPGQAALNTQSTGGSAVTVRSSIAPYKQVTFCQKT